MLGGVVTIWPKLVRPKVLIPLVGAWLVLGLFALFEAKIVLLSLPPFSLMLGGGPVEIIDVVLLVAYVILSFSLLGVAMGTYADKDWRESLRNIPKFLASLVVLWAFALPFGGAGLLIYSIAQFDLSNPVVLLLFPTAALYLYVFTYLAFLLPASALGSTPKEAIKLSVERVKSLGFWRVFLSVAVASVILGFIASLIGLILDYAGFYILAPDLVASLHSILLLIFLEEAYLKG